MTKKNSKGVSSRFKLVVQFAVAGIAVGYLYFLPATSEYISQLYLPSVKYPIIKDMGIFTLFLLPLVIVGASNAVNLTDGLDGLASGFLWFNCHPARVFMGDTGSLSIGGMLGMIAICCKQELLLVIIGFVFVMEAMSVILQVASFKLTGKRIFKMSPIHHHFELLGWEESKVINRFWIISIIAAMIGLMTLKIR